MFRIKWTRCAVLAAMVGLVSASHAADVTYSATQTGFWDDPAVWNLGVAPTNDVNAKINTQAGKTVTLTNSATIWYLALSSGDAATTSVIIDGGSLHSLKPGTSGWNAIGYDKSASLIIRNGGTWTVDGRVDVGLLDSVNTAVCSFTMEESSGDVVVANQFSVGFNFDGSHTTSARAYIEGGTLRVGGLFKIDTDGNSFMDVKKSGTVVIAGNVTNLLNGYVADGYLLGNSAVSNTLVVYDGTNTTLTALAPAILDYTGIALGMATNSILADGYTVGTITTGYVRGVAGALVLEQDPVGGTKGLPSGTPINLVIQEVPPATTVNISWSGGNGVWTNNANWTGSLGAPLRETQNIKATVANPTPCVLDTAVGVAHFVIDGGSVRLASGADLYAGQKPASMEWTGVGYKNPSTLLVESNAVLTAANHLLFSFSPNTGESTITIAGGTVAINADLDFGNADGTAWGIVTIHSGGLLRVGNLDFKETAQSKVTVHDGVLELSGNKTNNVTGWIASTNIVVSGSAYTLVYDGIKTILTVTNPNYGFAGWAATWGVNIGAETNDYDDDLVNNFYEYAFNGDPTDPLDAGSEPIFAKNGGSLEYIHLVRNDDTNLVYSVQTKDNLVYGTWTNIGYTVMGTNMTGGDYNVVTNLISTLKDQSFIQLKVETP